MACSLSPNSGRPGAHFERFLEGVRVRLEEQSPGSGGAHLEGPGSLGCGMAQDSLDLFHCPMEPRHPVMHVQFSRFAVVRVNIIPRQEPQQ
jgi:hypothetical protein